MTCEIIYYSATDTTAQIVKAFSKGLACNIIFTRIDMLSYRNAAPSHADLIVFASPVYGGRIPSHVMKCFDGKIAEGKVVVGIAVYGNMHSGISLLQLHELAKKHNCPFLGAGAFVAEHTYSFEDAPVAEGRPNENDLEQATKFALAVEEKINADNTSDVALPRLNYLLCLAKLPENTIRPMVKKPVIIGECNHCGACVAFCPTKAIDSDTLVIDASKCIRCFACVKKCPRKARKGELVISWLKYPFSAIGRKKKEPLWRV